MSAIVFAFLAGNSWHLRHSSTSELSCVVVVGVKWSLRRRIWCSCHAAVCLSAGVSDAAAVSLHRYCHQSWCARWWWRWRRWTCSRLLVPASTHRALLPHVRRRCLDRARSLAESSRNYSRRSFPRSPRTTTAVCCESLPVLRNVKSACSKNQRVCQVKTGYVKKLTPMACKLYTILTFKFLLIFLLLLDCHVSFVLDCWQ